MKIVKIDEQAFFFLVLISQTSFLHAITYWTDSGGIKHLWGVNKLLPHYMAQQPKDSHLQAAYFLNTFLTT
jgi:hypothetical protein